MTGHPVHQAYTEALDRAMDHGIASVIPLGRTVLCDIDDTDLTDSTASGGYMFESKAVGPCCADRFEARVRGYGEERSIGERCPGWRLVRGLGARDARSGCGYPGNAWTDRRPTVKRTGMPQRPTKLQRGKRLERGGELGRRTEIRRVSAKRQAENRERRAVIAALWPDGRPQCEWPGCIQFADDVHERLSRARGGSITDPDNLCPLCREHHDKVTFTPESELQAVYEADLLRHSWDAPRSGEAA